MMLYCKVNQDTLDPTFFLGLELRSYVWLGWIGVIESIQENCPLAHKMSRDDNSNFN